MYELWYTFTLNRFVREVFKYYELGSCQLYPNGWIIPIAFDKFFKLVGIKPTLNIVKTGYHLVTRTNGGNDRH